MRITDLSHIIEPGMPVYPGTRGPVFTTGNTIEKDGFAELAITLFTHTGTHIDCPAHILGDGAATDDLPAAHFFGRGMVIDCTSTASPGVIGVSDMRPYAHGIEGADFVLFRTGWDRRWGTREYFRDFPVPSAELIGSLARSRIRGVGMDAISIDAMDAAELPNHQALLGKNIVIIENLCRLDELASRDFYFSCLPLKIREGDGSPVRAVGIEF